MRRGRWATRELVGGGGAYSKSCNDKSLKSVKLKYFSSETPSRHCPGWALVMENCYKVKPKCSVQKRLLGSKPEPFEPKVQFFQYWSNPSLIV